MTQYNYDRQLERYLIQFVRIMSNWEISLNNNGDTMRVPCRLGHSQRMVEQILKRNSENTLNNAPQISCYITGIEKSDERRQNPTHVSKIHLRERSLDSELNIYGTEQGNAVTIERLMPVPYTLSVAADFWTTTTRHKMELFEQIGSLFNPSLELQHTDNFADWTAITELKLEQVTWTSRTIPVGSEEEIDFMTFAFTIPIWISVPAKVKKLGIITKIIASVFNSAGDLDSAILSEANLMSRQYITPNNYNVLLDNGRLHLLLSDQNVTDNSTDPALHNHSLDPDWSSLIQQFGTFTPGVSTILLLQSDGTEIAGTISRHATDLAIMEYNIDFDTTPTNSQQAVISIIDPTVSYPGKGLDTAVTGQRYLITKSVGDVSNTVPGVAWGAIDADVNDIIEYNGSTWDVALDSSVTSGNKFVTNLSTNIQYKWDGVNWTKAIDGQYTPGQWRIVI